MNCDEHDKKNNLNILLTEADEKDYTENIASHQAIHPLKRSKNPRPIDDEEWESMLKSWKSNRYI